MRFILSFFSVMLVACLVQFGVANAQTDRGSVPETFITIEPVGDGAVITFNLPEPVKSASFLFKTSPYINKSWHIASDGLIFENGIVTSVMGTEFSIFQMRIEPDHTDKLEKHASLVHIGQQGFLIFPQQFTLVTAGHRMVICVMSPTERCTDTAEEAGAYEYGATGIIEEFSWHHFSPIFIGNDPQFVGGADYRLLMDERLPSWLADHLKNGLSKTPDLYEKILGWTFDVPMTLFASSDTADNEDWSWHAQYTASNAFNLKFQSQIELPESIEFKQKLELLLASAPIEHVGRFAFPRYLNTRKPWFVTGVQAFWLTEILQSAGLVTTEQNHSYWASELKICIKNKSLIARATETYQDKVIKMSTACGAATQWLAHKLLSGKKPGTDGVLSVWQDLLSSERGAFSASVARFYNRVDTAYGSTRISDLFRAIEEPTRAYKVAFKDALKEIGETALSESLFPTKK